ncbi:MAG TPA: hypothetical protein VFN38_01615, partial [Gemmatimonadaceae bacterium]|nr:hypothetical protein [Gemmatimonadaceae bacterium]
SSSRLGILAAAALALLACERPRDAATREVPTREASAGPRPAATLDSVVVQDSAGWSSFQARLPKRADSAAAALERYRRTHGLPFEFFLRKDAPAALVRALRTEEPDMSCGTTFATAFVRRMPREHSVLDVAPVIEFDSTGRMLRRWPLPNDVEYWEMVAGVRGDELVTLYRPNGPEGVFLRVRPDGEYRVSAEPPQPLPPQAWIKVEDSVFLRVQPRDEGPYYAYPNGASPALEGTWEPAGDSGWYVRTDSGPKRGTRARARTLDNREPSPRILACPAGAAFEGMLCRGFPDGATERRIAYPTPCT